MAYFAELNENNIVVRVLATPNDSPNEGYDWLIENLGGRWLKTSYNSNIRKNYAGIGFIYDQSRDAFIAPKPYPSWILNEDTCRWEAPIPYPSDAQRYFWDEETGDWIPMTAEQEN